MGVALRRESAHLGHELQIDHLVAQSEAWKSGAYRWTAGTRRRYANDLGYSRSLIAVTAGVNMSKGDRGPGQWTPPARSYRCEYVAEYIAVKWGWRLSIDSFERASLRGLLNYCDKTVARAPSHRNGPRSR